MARNENQSPIQKGLPHVGTEQNKMTKSSVSEDIEEKRSSCSSSSSSATSSSSSSSGSTTATRRRPWKVSPARSLSAAGSLKGVGGGDATQVTTEPNSKSNSNRHLLLLRRHSAIFPHRLRRDIVRSFCFCCFCCCSCSCMSGKKSQRKDKKDASAPAGQDNSENEPLPSVEEIRAWGESFDRLMKCSAGRQLFRQFLKLEYSEENIMFWLACEELKMECNPEAIEEKCRLIYEDYVSILSPREVSLDSKVRDIVNQNMETPTTNTFDDAQLQIYTLMGRDSYPRFVSSTMYRSVAQLSPTSTKDSVG